MKRSRYSRPRPKILMIVSDGEIVDHTFVPRGHEGCGEDVNLCENEACWKPWPDRTPTRP